VKNTFLLDTDTASYIIKGTSPELDARLAKQPIDRVFISSVTRAELLFGVRRLAQAHQNVARLAKEVDHFLSTIHTLAWDDGAADAFADIRVALERGGTPIGVMDTMIAAHAMAVSATLVTNNVRHFRRVKSLTVQNWTVA
jgi:tRNA(fMet)-specific endonuclease VapC